MEDGSWGLTQSQPAWKLWERDFADTMDSGSRSLGKGWSGQAKLKPRWTSHHAEDPLSSASWAGVFQLLSRGLHFCNEKATFISFPKEKWEESGKIRRVFPDLNLKNPPRPCPRAAASAGTPSCSTNGTVR